MPEYVRCPYCQGQHVRRQGRTAQGKPRFLCQDSGCGKSFLRDYSQRGRLPDMQARILALLKKGHGVRATARLLMISPNTVIHARRRAEETNQP